MPSAKCPHCGQTAFSSADFNRLWDCPYCGKQVVPTPPTATKPGGREPEAEYYSRFWTVKED